MSAHRHTRGPGRSVPARPDGGEVATGAAVQGGEVVRRSRLRGTWRQLVADQRGEAARGIVIAFGLSAPAWAGIAALIEEVI